MPAPKRKATPGAKAPSPPSRRAAYVRARPASPTKVGEARAEPAIYAISSKDSVATTRLSSKNQITIPVHMVRLLDLKPGDELDIVFAMGSLVVEKAVRGRDLVKKLAGSMASAPWDTPESVEAYVQAERESWKRQWDED